MSDWKFRTLIGLHLFTISAINSHHDANVMGLILLYAAVAFTFAWWPFRKSITDKQEQND